MPGPGPQPDVTAKFGPPVLERVQNSSILDTLVPDLWVEIFKNLTVIEILRTRQTCQALRNVTSLRSVWFNAIKNLIDNENLSIPRLTLPLNTYSTDVLESLAVRTVQLSLNLSAPVPRLVSWVSWSVCSDAVRNLYITQVLFVSGMDNSKWILTVYGGRSIACWEILSDPLVVLPAGGWDSQQILIDVSVNKVKSHEATFAVTTEHHGTYRGLIMGWEHMRSGDIPTVTTLATLVFPPGRLRLLEGDLVYFYRKRRGGICTAVNWRTKAQHCFPVHPIDMPNPPHSNLTPKCFAVHAQGGKLLVVTLEFIHVWEFENTSTDNEQLIYHRLLHSYCHSLRVEAASVTPYNHAWDLLSSKLPSDAEGVSILLRCRDNPSQDSLHHIVVTWNPSSLDEPDVQVHSVQQAAVGSHFMSDIKITPSGRGMLIRGPHTTKSETVPEGLSTLDVLQRDPRTGYMIPGQGTMMCRNVSSGMDDPIGHSTSMDYDDAEGRAVVATFDGTLRLFDLVE